MLKGTQVLIGEQAAKYEVLCDVLSMSALSAGYERVYLPTIWEAEIFKQKIQGETLDQMWQFRDKGDRDVCLIPEVTAIIVEKYKLEWSKNLPKPLKLYYIQKCFRYEQPKAGRLREFTQFGVEWLSPKLDDVDVELCKSDLEKVLDRVCEDLFEWNDQVKRGLGYYIADGFEATVATLGAAKQIAGGGRYAEGVGWAIGVERLLLALELNDTALEKQYNEEKTKLLAPPDVESSSAG